MTKDEANQIIESIKQGRHFVQEDAKNSLVTRWRYDTADKSFIAEQQDTITGYLLNEIKHKEEAFLKILLNN